MFMRLQTQWIMGGMGSVIGMNYQSIEFMFRTHEVRNRRELLTDIQEIERGALDAIAKQNERKAASQCRLIITQA